jgi:hypothetical protein
MRQAARRPRAIAQVGAVQGMLFTSERRRGAKRWVATRPAEPQRNPGPLPEAATGHVRSFAAMMAVRSAERLAQRVTDACADESHGLRAFADGLMTDLDAVALGLSTPWNSGCVGAA